MLEWIKELLLIPIEVFQSPYEGTLDFLFMMFICWIVPAAFVAFVVFAATHITLYYVRRRRCDKCSTWVHPDSRINKDTACICYDCEKKTEAATESLRNCCDCSTASHPVSMRKEMHETDRRTFIIDRCPQCQGVFLDPDELKGIVEAVAEDANDNISFSSSNFLVGIAVGTIIG